MTIALALAGGSWAAGCGSEDQGGADVALDVAFPDAPDTAADTSTTVVAFVALCDGYADACCKLERCFYPNSAVSDEACKVAARGVCEATVQTPLGTYIDPGTIHYRGDVAGECYAPYLAVACDDVGDLTGSPPLACNQAFEGTLDEGAACAFDDLCKPELFCKPAADGTCPGTCARRAGLGERCNQVDALCAKDLRCGTWGAEDSICVAPKVAHGEPCKLFEQCPDGDFCDSESGTCEARIAAGAACKSGCVAGYTCDGEPGAMTCVKLPVKGEPCDFMCALPAVCIDKVCVDQPVAGDSCDNEFSSCGSFLATLQCDPKTKTCVPYLPLGATCGGVDAPSRCAGGYCDRPDFASPGTCKAYKGYGEACTGYEMCGKLTCKDDGTCGVDTNPCRGPGPLNAWQ